MQDNNLEAEKRTDLASQFIKEEPSAVSPILHQDNLFVNKGWQCSVCGRVYSPTTPMCFYCGNKAVINQQTSKMIMESVIKWQTREPNENGLYIVSYQSPNSSSANVTALVYIGKTWINGDWQEIDKNRITAWCKLRDIEPYKTNINE